MRQLTLTLLVTVFLSFPAAAQQAPCAGERVTVLPLFPVATSPGVARAEEQRLRDELGKDRRYCVQPRAETLSRLGAASPMACEDALCRRRLAERVGADWLVFGMVFGFGGKTSLTAQAWDASGERLSKRTFGADAEGMGAALIGGARALPSAGLPREASVRGRAVPIALAGVGVIALAAGAAFGISSAETARGLSTAQPGCAGTGPDYVTCLQDRTQLGRNQAAAANWLYGAAAVLGTTASVFWVMEWP